ncbi:TPA: tail fiber protein [Vibrio parahaemolyticus]
MSNTATDLYQRLGDVINNWQAFVDQQREWLAAPNETLDDATDNKGKRYLSDSTGNQVLVDSPSQIQYRMDQAVAAVENALPTANEALSKASAALDYSNSIEATLDEKVSAASASEGAAKQAEINASNHEAQSLANKNSSAASANESEVSNQESQAAASAARDSEQNAKASELSALDAANDSELSRQASEASAVAAKNSENKAKISETNAKSSENASLASEHKAKQWAEQGENVEVESGKFSAKHHAIKAANDAAFALESRNSASASQVAAKQSEDNAKTHELNAAAAAGSAADSASESETSRQASDSSAIAAAASEAASNANKVAAENAANSANQSKLDAANSAAAANDSETASAAHASSASDSAASAISSKNAAANSATASENSRQASDASASAAKTSETNAGVSRDEAASFASSASDSKDEAAASAESSASSAASSEASKVAAKASEDAAEASQVAAKASEVAAKASETAAKNSEIAAKASETASKASENTAKSYRDSSASSASIAESAAERAEQAATQASSIATRSVQFKGKWDASSGNFPVPSDPEMPDYYRVTVGGTMSGPQGTLTVDAGDDLYWDMDSDVWYKVDNTDKVASVNGKIGNVVLSKNDIGLNNVPNWSASDIYTSSGTNLATRNAVNGAYSALDASKLGKTEKAADSDKLDGLDSTQFLRSDVSDTMSGNLTVSGKITSGSAGFKVGEGLDIISQGDYFPGSNYYDARIFRMIDANGANGQVDGGIVFEGYTPSDGVRKEVLTLRTNGEFNFMGQKVFHDGYHPNADKWTTARTLTLTGDVTGSVSWDGSANASISVSVNNDSHTHDSQYLSLEGGSLSEKLKLNAIGEVLRIDGGLEDGLSDRLGGQDAYIYFGNQTYAWLLKYVGSTSSSAGNGLRFESTNSGKYWQFDHQGAFEYFDGTSKHSVMHSGNYASFADSRYYKKSDVDSMETSLQSQIDDRVTFDNTGLIKSIPYIAVGNAGSSLTVDFDAIDEPGIYARLFRGDSINRPDNKTGYGYIQNFSYNRGNLTQFVIPYGTSSSSGRFAFRTRYSDEWSDWEYLYSTNNKPTASDVGALSKTSSHTDNVLSGAIGATDSKPLVQLHNGHAYFGSIGRDGLSLASSSNPVWVVNDSTSHKLFNDVYHPNADKWTVARTITLSGDLTGSVSIDGSSDVVLSASVNNDSHTHDDRYLKKSGDALSGDLSLGGNKLVFTDETSVMMKGVRSTIDLNSRLFSEEGGFSYTTYNSETSNKPEGGVNNANALFTFNAHSGSTYTHQLSFNSHGSIHHRVGTLAWERLFTDNYHPVADKWTNARTLTLTGDASGSVSWDGSENVSMSVSVANDSHTHDGRYYTESEADARFVRSSGGTVTGALNTSELNVNTNEGSTPFRLQRNSSSQTGQDDNVSVHVDDSSIYFTHNNDADGDASGYYFRYMTGGNATTLLGFNSNSITYRGHNIWHAGNDGSGSGLDADKLDGLQASQFVRSDSSSTINGQLTIRHTNVQLNLMDSTYNDNYWQLDHQNGDLAFRYNGSSAADFTIRENGTAVFAHTVTAPAFSGSLSGNASSASKWASARTISLSGDASGSVSIDGSSNRTLSVSVSNSDKLDGKDSSNFTQVEPRRYFNVPSTGWYKIADTNGGDHGACIITIGDYTGGKHTYAKFLITNSHGQSEITQLVGNSYGGPGFYHVRTMYNSSDRVYGGHSFEVYAVSGTGLYYTIERINQSNMYTDWRIIPAQASPSGWTQDKRLSDVHANTLQSTGSIVSSYNITAGGNISASGDISGLSDRRLKREIKVISDALNKVKALSGYTYIKANKLDKSASDYREFVETGLIAQELERVLPEAVKRHGDDGLLSVAYGNTVGLLVEAIKELSDRVDALEGGRM